MNEEVKVLDMTHADEVIREVDGGVAPTMQSRMGTGGNQVPLVMDRASEQAVCIEGDLTRPSHMGSGVSTDGASFTLQAREAATKQHGVAIGVSFDGRKDAPVIPECAHTECVGTNPGFKNGVAIGIDPYNATDTGDTAATLGINAGVSTGRNGIAIILKVRCGKDTYTKPDGSVGTAGKYPLASEESAFTLAATQDQHLVLRHIVRRLTPTEAERLQAFPDGWTKIPWRTYQESRRKGMSYERLLNERGMRLREPTTDQCPDSPRYKALGNSWATNCAEWILRRIVAAFRLGMI